MLFQFNNSQELQALRNTRFYTKFRPYVTSELAQYEFTADHQIHEQHELKLHPTHRFLAALDILLGDIFENVRCRQFIRHLCEEHAKESVLSPTPLNNFHRWYLHELVVLYDRFERMLGVTELAYGVSNETREMERTLLQIFPPTLFDKRNHTQHKVYLGVLGASRSTSYVQSDDELKVRQSELRQVLSNLLKIHSDSEQGLIRAYDSFLEHLYVHIHPNNVFAQPHLLKKQFRIGQRIDRAKHRLRSNHHAIFSQGNPK